MSLQSEEHEKSLRRLEDDADYEEDESEEEPLGDDDDGSDYVEELPDEDDASYGSLRSRSSTCGDTPGNRASPHYTKYFFLTLAYKLMFWLSTLFNGLVRMRRFRWLLNTN